MKSYLLIVTQSMASLVFCFSIASSWAQENENDLLEDVKAQESFNKVDSTPTPSSSSIVESTTVKKSKIKSTEWSTNNKSQLTKETSKDTSNRVKENALNSAPQAGIVILNSNQGPAANAVTQQPTTYVEADASLNNIDYKTEDYRRARQNAEVATEKKIAEKLEEARLLDEKRRLDQIMGLGLDNRGRNNPLQEYGSQNNMPVSPSQSLPAYPVQKNKVIVDPSLIQNHTEDTQDVADSSAEEKLEPIPRYFVTGLVGSGNYIGVSNMQGNIAAGISVGSLLPNRVSIEASLIYANFYIDEYWWNFPYFREMDQYSLNVSAKYNFQVGIVRPSLGGLVGYTYRKYFDRSYYGFGSSNDSQVSSHAIDLGLIGGLEIDITQSFSIGLDYRYVTNLSSRADSEYLTSRSYWREGQPVEKTDYSFISLIGKFYF